MKLLKFGGTSLANAKKFLSVSDIIEKNIKTNQVAVVLSAPAKVTNYLVTIIEKKIQNDKILETINLAENIFIQIINDLLKMQLNFPYRKIEEIIKKEFDQLKNMVQEIIFLKKYSDSNRAIIISRGEILSVSIMETILKHKNYDVTIIDPVKNFLSIGDNYLDSSINISESKKRISNINFNKNTIILMPGFISGNQKRELVVLGRNGSDYSAAVLAACLNADCCEIWTDVDGVFTCDPKKVPNAYLLKTISYKEAMELSYFGAKVLHPRTIEPIAQFNIPCFIKNTFNTQSTGTLICQNNASDQTFLKGITNLDNITMFKVSGRYVKNMNNILSRIFNIISRNNIKILLITQSSSENKINFCIFKHEVDKIIFSFNKEFTLELKNGLLNPLQIKNNLSILSVIGSNINQKYNIASKIFSVLGTLKINVLAIGQGSSEHSISLVIEEKNILKAIQNVHDMLFYNRKILHVFLIGIGGVGHALLKQILQQQKFLREKNIEIKICAIANSKKILFLDDTINISDWKDHFKKSKTKFSLKILKQVIQNNYLINSVIIDCTSDQLLSEQYESFLYHDFHIVASNKKANTNNWDYYQKIRTAISKTNKKFLYETNVGAGLPIIKTIQNLFQTGDTLIRFKGVLSGSLSFIFGQLEEGISLSQATRKAKKLGFTEPNPYDDLSGIDVARKLLILARESGYKLELEDIKIEPLLPNFFKKNENIDEFLSELKQLDSHFLEKSNKAKQNGNVLRFIATIEKTGQCFVKIEEVNIHDPLYKVKNGENALAFYTNYYQPIPLVLRGYGAGNNVTASGVFSDLLRTL